MSNFNVMKKFLSCPGDMAEEKRGLKQFIEDFSKGSEKKYNIELKVLTREDDAQRGKGRGQEKINKLIEKCQIYIGLMFKRFGGSTGVVQSGTHEKYIYAFFRSDKENLPYMRFFFKRFSLADDAPDDDVNQFQLIRQF